MILYNAALALKRVKDKIKAIDTFEELSIVDKNCLNKVIKDCHEITKMTKCCDSPDWQIDIFDEICCGNCGKLLKEMEENNE